MAESKPSAMQQIIQALESCTTGGYVDIDGDYCKTWHFDEAKVNAALSAARAMQEMQAAQPEAQQDAKPVAADARLQNIVHRLEYAIECFPHTSVRVGLSAALADARALVASPTAPAPAGAEAQQDAPATQRLLALLQELKPMAAYGVVGSRDVDQAKYQRAIARIEAELLSGVAAPAGADIDAKLEQLIEESDGQWREDVFLIEASPLWELLRQAAALSGAPAVAVAEPPWKTMTDDESMRLGKGHTPAQVYAVAEAHGRRYLLPSRFDTSDDATAQRRACEALVASGHARWLTVNQALGIRLTGKPLTSSPAAKEDQRG